MIKEVAIIASRISEMRDICGFSAEELASKLEIPVETYEGYESSGLDIPISVLYKLSAIFQVDLNELLTGNTPHLSTYCHVKKGNGLAVDRYPGYNFKSLAYTYKNRLLEPLLVTVEPSDHDPALVTHSGQEFNICLEGTIEVLFDRKRIVLETGDSLYFNPTHPHGQRAIGGTAKFLTIITQ